MNYFDELVRIADTLAAAVKLMPGPEPRFEETKKVEGWGWIHRKVY